MSAPPLGTILRNLRTLTVRHHAARSDAELLTRFISERDETAFEVLVWRHGGLVYQLGRRLLGREADVEDAFQATFLILARDAPRIAQRGSLAGWLYRVGYRVALRIRRRRPAFEPLPIDLVGPHPEPADQCAQREHCGLLLDEIARLPECYRLTVVLCCLEGKTNSQAADELGCPCGTVDSRLAWARRRLRERLTRRGVAPALAGTLSLGLAWEAQAVPAKLAASTAPLAVALATGRQQAVSSAITLQTLDLLRGVHPMFSLSKIKLIAAVVVVAGLIGVGAGGHRNAQALAEDESQRADQPLDVRSVDRNWHRTLMVKFAGEAPISIAFTPDGKALAMGGTNLQMTGFIQLRDLNTRETIWSWTVNPSVKSIAFSPDGKRLASVEGNGLGVLRDATSGEQLALIKGGNVAVLVFGPSGEIAIGTRKGKLAFSRNGNLPPSLPDGAGEAARFAAFSPDGRRIAWARGESVVYMDAAELLKLVWEFKPAGNPQQVAYSPDGKLVAVAHGADVTLLDATTGKAVREFKGGADAKSAMALSPDGRLIAVGNASGNIFLLEMSTGRIVARLSEHTSRVVQLVFSPDGRLLASADDHGMVLTWEKGAKPSASDAGDRLDQLVAQLAKSGRTNEQCIEALFLTMLGRFPQDAEAKRLAERLNKSQDRKDTLLDVVWALQNSLEFKAQLEVLQKRRAQLAIP